MRKTPSLFLRDFSEGGNSNYVTSEPNPECQWVFDGEGVPTRKYDGTCVMFDGDKWWARREVKPGKSAPPNWVECDGDDATGKRMGWEPIEQSGWRGPHSEAVAANKGFHKPGTYELIGPKIQGNPENVPRHQLIAHDDAEVLPDVPLQWGDRLFDYFTELSAQGIEGIVWHHPDGRMAKLKVRDVPNGG